jgi:hypothetical protein
MVNFNIIRHQTHNWERIFALVIFRVTKIALKIFVTKCCPKIVFLKNPKKNLKIALETNLK